MSPPNHPSLTLPKAYGKLIAFYQTFPNEYKRTVRVPRWDEFSCPICGARLGAFVPVCLGPHVPRDVSVRSLRERGILT